MSEENKTVSTEEQDLANIIDDMEQVDAEKEIDIPLFQNLTIETPFSAVEKTKPEQPAMAARNNYVASASISDEECTVIGTSTVIASNISCGGNMEIRGRVKGKVLVSGKAEVYGTLEQGIEANEFIAHTGAKIDGDIVCRTQVHLTQGTTISGNIITKDAVIESVVKGNIEASSELRLGSTAVVTGDITTSSITVDNGAIINGRLSIKR